MLYWMIQHELPDEVHTYETSFSFDQDHLVSCWLLAKKWEVRAFQDEVMVTLLESFNPRTPGWLSVEAILDAFDHTRPGSKLREALVENVVQQQKEQPDGKHLLKEQYVEPHRKTAFYKDYQKKKEEWEREWDANSEPMWSHRFANEDPDFWETYLFDPERYHKLRYCGFECVDGWQSEIYIQMLVVNVSHWYVCSFLLTKSTRMYR